MKLLPIIGLISSTVLTLFFIAEKNDYAAFAWGLISLYNLKDVINERQAESNS